LSIATFTDFQLNPCGWDIGAETHRWCARPQLRLINNAGLRWLGHPIVEQHTLAQTLHGFVGGDALDLGEVSFFFFMVWIGEQGV